MIQRRANKKSILIFIDWYLPGYKAGGPVSSVANLVQHLEKNFNFYIVTRNTEYLESEPYPDIDPDKWLWMEKYNAHILYLSKDSLRPKKIYQIIKTSKAQIVYINGIYSWYFSILPLYYSKKLKKKSIVAARGMLSNHAFSSKSLKKKSFLFLCNTLGLYNNIKLQATNSHEVNEIKKAIKGNFIIHKVLCLPKSFKKNIIYKIVKEPEKLKLVSIARISIEKNTKFICEILNDKYEGKIEMDLYGSIYNKEYWKECEILIKSLKKNISIKYKGSVEPEKVAETFQKYHFSFMPSQGENFGHSHLESMLVGVPVITSNNTPWKNMESTQKKIISDYIKHTSGWDLPLSNPERFKEIIRFCIQLKQEEYNIISENAIKFPVQAMNIDYIKGEYLKLFNE